MGLLLWLDDERKPPPGYDLWAKDVPTALGMLEKSGVSNPKRRDPHVGVEHVSLDHDLCEDHYEDAVTTRPIDRSQYSTPTGYAVLEWMRDKGLWVPSIYVHTLNRVGAAEMIALACMHAPAGVTVARVYPKHTAPERKWT